MCFPPSLLLNRAVKEPGEDTMDQEENNGTVSPESDDKHGKK
jgi:hypothetical protein